MERGVSRWHLFPAWSFLVDFRKGAVMSYSYLPVENTRHFCQDIFIKSGFSESESCDIVDVLLKADLYGIESHGIQRLIRYFLAMQEGSILPQAEVSVVHQTPISEVWDAPKTMGQVVAKKAMETAIEKAKKFGVGTVCVRNSNHYGIAGYYTSMAAAEDLLGVSMTNTEAIAIPTNGRKAMLGTSPIAVCMPADPVNFWYDASTTVVTRGKLEVYRKQEKPLEAGWAADENGQGCADADHVLNNIIGKLGGGIFPLGGETELLGSHKGYGFGMIVEIFTSIFAGGTTSPHVVNSGNGDTSFSFWAIDYGIFGNKAEIKDRLTTLLQEMRESPKALGKDRIYTHGEKEAEMEAKLLESGIPVNEKTLEEIKQIGAHYGLAFDAYFE
ncbi:Malate/lactate/ureidoglycolate dehydrogenase, LDH2 family [Acidaminobacter hydrogenoformans DSM 2784]|uniref:Malate/lactate/ureidoglycolate dehydrogenase, LDH2 family n=2 Tax=Acidaminobacter TaxID=65402 RepID=A0A1G5RQY5_9FIRM|nr:Malate/lactate/ureidoglycolate dehydrogenase, LDH2 family [Acidaminobacter hydrogenoformans DSM 2784]